MVLSFASSSVLGWVIPILSITRLPANEGDITASQAWDRGEATLQVEGGSAAAWQVHLHIYCAAMSWQLHEGFIIPYTRFPSLSRTLVTSWALNHLNYTSTSRNHPENLLLYYVDLTLLLSAVVKLGEWRWCCQGTIWAFGMLSHRDGGGRRGLLVWLLVPAVMIKGWNRLCISMPKIFNFLWPCPVFLPFTHIGLLCCIVQYSVVHNTICIERGNYL